MRYVTPFALDCWNSCISPLSLGALAKLADGAKGSVESLAASVDNDLVLSYGNWLGSPRLRQNIAALYPGSPVTSDDLIVTSGAISANYLIADTLVGPGDHVICQYPTYGQLFEVPRRGGADVSLWRMREDLDWDLDVNELKGLIKSNTKLIILNSPANPTGKVHSKEKLESIVAAAKEHDIFVMCDEVFRPLFHKGTPAPPSLLQLGYPKSIVSGSMSKSYALPGIRVGWIALHPSLRDSVHTRLVQARDYTTIAVSQLDDGVAAFALQPAVRDAILARSAAITARNIEVLEKWSSQFGPQVKWHKPEGGGTSMLFLYDKSGAPIDDAEFAAALAAQGKTVSPPLSTTFATEGGAPALKGGLRVGVVMREGVIEAGLKAIEALLRERQILD